ncbi:hypothetical protein ACLB2K_026348 [Fragaria x ananassa]
MPLLRDPSMASLVLLYLSQWRLPRNFFFIPTTLSLATSLLILFYISTTSNLFPPLPNLSSFAPQIYPFQSQRSLPPNSAPNGNYDNNNEVFHDTHIFVQDYKEMKRSFKIYVYPHTKDDPFANALLPVDFEPAGNYASESYFKKVLMESHFITNDPTQAQLFFLPFSIARLRHDPRVGVGGIQDFIRDYMFNISHKYQYWNRTGGADHFYVACHSIGRSAKKQPKSNLMPFNLCALQVTSYLGTLLTRMHVSLKFGPENRTPLTFCHQIEQNLHSLPEELTPQYGKGFFKFGERTPRFL